MCSVRVLFVGSFNVCVGDLLTGVFDSCSVCWIIQCMCQWLVDRCVWFVFCLSDRSVYVLVTC